VTAIRPKTMVRTVILASVLTMAAGGAFAQTSGGPGFFIPHPKAAPQAVQRSLPREQLPQEAEQQAGQEQGPPGQLPQGTIAAEQPKMPPIPNLPALPKSKAPPASVMGVLAVTQVMQESTAAQGVEKIIQARRQVLAKQAQAEGLKVQNEQKVINSEKAKLAKATLISRENALQQEYEAAQITFHNKNIAIQISARTALAKIESTLIAVIRQVSQSHGMNLVLHRSQVALNVNEFDISQEVAAQLNKILPAVAVPPSVVPKAALSQAKALQAKGPHAKGPHS
jgi:Skp family chaperone for outer membrane proteins